MEIIKIKPNTVFLLEIKTPLPERQTEELLTRWNEIFPENKLLIFQANSLKILEFE